METLELVNEWGPIAIYSCMHLHNNTGSRRRRPTTVRSNDTLVDTPFQLISGFFHVNQDVLLAGGAWPHTAQSLNFVTSNLTLQTFVSCSCLPTSCGKFAAICYIAVQLNCKLQRHATIDTIPTWIGNAIQNFLPILVMVMRARLPYGARSNTLTSSILWPVSVSSAVDRLELTTPLESQSHKQSTSATLQLY